MELQQHKRGNSSQEIQVSIIVHDLVKFVQVADLQTFREKFKVELEKIEQKNFAKASFFYKIIETEDANVLEVWKMKANCERNYKMFTITIK